MYKSSFFYKILAIQILFICCPNHCISQDPGQEIDSLLWKEISALVYLDSITISPLDNDLDLDAFIQHVLEDESFYNAFRNLRFFGYSFQEEIAFFNKKNKASASYRADNIQTVENQCREMEIVEKNIEGNYFKKRGGYRYYTSKMIDRVFYTHGQICDDSTQIFNPEAQSRFENTVNDLKTVIFSPGRNVEIPLIGNKLSIFSSKMQEYYTYTISFVPMDNGKFAYLFDVEIKAEHAASNNTVISKMSTWFEENNFQILKRSYHLKTDNILYAFNIEIDVDLAKWNSKYFPSFVAYKGHWKLLGKKAEHCVFSFKLSQFN